MLERKVLSLKSCHLEVAANDITVVTLDPDPGSITVGLLIPEGDPASGAG